MKTKLRTLRTVIFTSLGNLNVCLFFGGVSFFVTPGPMYADQAKSFEMSVSWSFSSTNPQFCMAWPICVGGQVVECRREKS